MQSVTQSVQSVSNKCMCWFCATTTNSLTTNQHAQGGMQARRGWGVCREGTTSHIWVTAMLKHLEVCSRTDRHTNKQTQRYVHTHGAHSTYTQSYTTMQHRQTTSSLQPQRWLCRAAAATRHCFKLLCGCRQLSRHHSSSTSNSNSHILPP